MPDRLQSAETDSPEASKKSIIVFGLVYAILFALSSKIKNALKVYALYVCFRCKQFSTQIKGLRMLDFRFVQLAIKELMRDKGFTVRKLAEAAGVNPSSVQRVVAGENYTPTKKTLEKIAEGLGTSIMEIYAFAENISRLSVGEIHINNSGDGAIVASTNCTSDVRHQAGISTLIPKQKESDRFVAKSDSMAPLILDGDDLYVGPSDNAKSNDIVLAEKEDGSETLVRLVRDGDVLWGRVDNPDWPGEKLFPIRKVLWKVIGFKRMF